ncbi:MAG: hypothetical protein ABFS37_04160 [Acidobacteriota bacterium]
MVLLLFVSAQGSASQWNRWEWLNPRPQGHSLSGFAASDFVAVAVGENGIILASENGLDWDTVHSKSGLILEDVIWAGDRFVAVGGYSLGLGEPAYSPGVILTSGDGRQWAESLVVDGTIFRRAIYTGEQILVVGFRGKTATSPDGIHWAEHTMLDYPNSDIIDVSWNGSTYVGVGAINYFTGGMAILLSEDGIDWAAASLGGISGMGMFCVVWGHDRFLAFGGGWPGPLVVLSSPDAQTWTRVSSDLNVYINEAVATPDGYLAVSDGGRIGRSYDGQSWSVSVELTSSKRLLDVERFQGQYVVVGEDGAIASSSDDGGTWATITTWEIDSGGIVDISSGDGILVALGGNGGIYRSLDGLAWQKVRNYQTRTFSVQRFLGAFWVVGDFRTIARSEDGIDWDLLSHGFGSDYADIATNGEVIVAVGRKTFGSALVATSTDGFAWNEMEIEGAEGLRIASVTWTGTRFVGVGSGGAIFRSDDGYSWSLDTPNSTPNLWRVISNGSVVVALAGTYHGRSILISKDHGVTWQSTFVDRPLFDVVWTGDLFVVVGAGVWSSHSGDHWTRDPVGFLASPYSVIGDEDEIILLGGDGMVMRAQRVTPLLEMQELD